MMMNESSSEPIWTDPDDVPPAGREWFEQADQYRDDALIRRGRPFLANPKRAVSLRLDADVIAHYRAGGPGWQTRMNDELRRAAGI